MEPQQMLGVLLNMTEQQSQTTEKLLGELKGQIAALALATKVTQNAASSIGQSAASVEQAARNAAPKLQKAAEEAVSEAVGIAVRRALAEASGTTVAAMEEASKPMLNKLSSMAATVNDAEEQLNEATASFGWKWAVIAGGTLAGTLAIFILVAWMAIWLQRFHITELSEQKVQLQGEIAQLQEQADMLAKKGGRIKLTKCGGPLCIEASSNQGKGAPEWTGSWKNNENGAALVIPRGYL